MDKQKVEQALKEIFNGLGAVTVHNHSAFKAAVFDLLDETNCSDERMVFRHAMDSKAFWILLETQQITEDHARKAAEQIQKESHMTKEDTEFVLQCIVTAYGGNPDTVVGSTQLRQDVETKEQKEGQTRQEETQKNNLQQSNQGQVKTSGSNKGETFAVIIAILAVCIPGLIGFLFVFLGILLS